jgi:hypothetical protein
MAVTRTITQVYAGPTAAGQILAPTIDIGLGVPAAMSGTHSTGGIFAGDSVTSGTVSNGARVVQTMDLSTRRYVGFTLISTGMNLANIATYANGGIRIVFQDGSGNWAAYTLHGGDVGAFLAGSDSAFTGGHGFPGNDQATSIHWWLERDAPPFASSGVLNWANITAYEIHHRMAAATRASAGGARFVTSDLPLHTGNVSANGLARDMSDGYGYPSGGTLWSLPWMWRVATRFFLASAQPPAHISLGFQVGDGATTTNLNFTSRSIIFAPLWADNVVGAEVPNSAIIITTPRLIDIFQAATDNVTIADCLVSAGRLWGLRVRGNTAGIAALTRDSFVRYAQMELGHSTSTDCIWDGGTAPIQATGNSTITRGTIRNATAGGLTLTGAPGNYTTKLDATFTNNTTFDIALGSGGVGTYNLAGVKVNSGYTLKIHNNSANAIIVEVPAGITTSTTTAGGSITISTPPVTRGLAFTGLIAGSQVVVYDTGTTTELFRTNSSATSETWSETVAGSRTVDYTIMLAGRLPIRVAGVTVTGALSGGVLSTPVQQVLDRSYVASTGLVFTTNCTLNPLSTPPQATWNVNTTGQNFYSFAIEAWIAQSSLRNVAFPFTTNGPNSFTFGNGWEVRGFSTAGTGISNTSLSRMSRDGLRYVDTGGVVTAIFAAIFSVDTAAGLQVRYQQTDGGTTVNAASTGPIDQLIQVFGGPSHGNFDRRNWLTLKVQKDGYDQAETNAVATYGNLEDQLYVIGLNPVPNGVAAGDPALANPPTITDWAGSPVTWNGKAFSIRIQDSAAGNTGTQIMRWIRYQLSLGTTFQGKNGFNWHDLVQTNGNSFKTVRGAVYGDTGAALKGVYVVTSDGVTPHPGFNSFMADDGTTYAPPASSTITLSGVVAGSRVQIYDTANGVELLNSTSVYTYSETYSVARTLRIRVAYQSGTSAKNFIEANIGSTSPGSPNITYIVNQTDDAVYNANGLNGSAVTGITISDGIDRMVINIAGGSVSWPQIYAYNVYWLTTAAGIIDDGSIIVARDTANYLVTLFKIRNSSTTPLSITGGYGVDSTTGTVSPLIDTVGSSGNIYQTPDHVIPYSTGGTLVVSGTVADVTTSVLNAVKTDPSTLTVGKFLGLKD